jgi:hypothetical protein
MAARLHLAGLPLGLVAASSRRSIGGASSLQSYTTSGRPLLAGGPNGASPATATTTTNTTTITTNFAGICCSCG